MSSLRAIPIEFEHIPSLECSSGVVPLYDVLRFMAENFWKASQIITEWGLNAGFPITPRKALETVETLSNLQRNIGALGLVVSARETHKLNIEMGRAVTDIQRLAKEKQKAEFKKVSADLRSRFDRLSSVIHSELESRVLYVMQVEKEKYCNPKWLQDTPIFTNFPDAFREFQCAGRCYAYDECTAAVFHLMRVIDSGLRLVYESLGEVYDARNWDGIAKKIEREMMKKHQEKSEEWRKKEPFYSGILTDIRSIGRAHRNPALHDIERNYSDPDAKYLIDVTKAFMCHLAENGMKEAQ